MYFLSNFLFIHFLIENFRDDASKFITDKVNTVLDALNDVNESALDLIQEYVNRISNVGNKIGNIFHQSGSKKGSGDKLDEPVASAQDNITVTEKVEISTEQPAIIHNVNNNEGVELNIANTEKNLDDADSRTLLKPLHVAFASYKNAIHQLAHKVKTIPDKIFRKIHSLHVPPKNMDEPNGDDHVSVIGVVEISEKEVMTSTPPEDTMTITSIHDN